MPNSAHLLDAIINDKGNEVDTIVSDIMGEKVLSVIDELKPMYAGEMFQGDDIQENQNSDGKNLKGVKDKVRGKENQLDLDVKPNIDNRFQRNEVKNFTLSRRKEVQKRLNRSASQNKKLTQKDKEKDKEVKKESTAISEIKFKLKRITGGEKIKNKKDARIAKRGTTARSRKRSRFIRLKKLKRKLGVSDAGLKMKTDRAANNRKTLSGRVKTRKS